MIVLEVLCTEFVMHERADFFTGTLLSEQKPKDAKSIPYRLLINKFFLCDLGWPEGYICA